MGYLQYRLIVPAIGIDIAHVDHLHTPSVLLPQLDLLLVVQKVAEVLYFLDEDGMCLRDVEGGVDDGLVLLAELLYIGVFLLG